jgi:hypothetical protein
MLTRRKLLLALCLVAAALVWNAVSAMEVATLSVPGARDDHYARVWVVDAKPYVWIRAETPRRRWLEPLRTNPNVWLWRGGRRHPYRARIWEETDAHAYVDELFRAKYGLLDGIRRFGRREPTILIRLEPL